MNKLLSALLLSLISVPALAIDASIITQPHMTYVSTNADRTANWMNPNGVIYVIDGKEALAAGVPADFVGYYYGGDFGSGIGMVPAATAPTTTVVPTLSTNEAITNVVPGTVESVATPILQEPLDIYNYAYVSTNADGTANWVNAAGETIQLSGKDLLAAGVPADFVGFYYGGDFGSGYGMVSATQPINEVMTGVLPGTVNSLQPAPISYVEPTVTQTTVSPNVTYSQKELVVSPNGESGFGSYKRYGFDKESYKFTDKNNLQRK